MKLFLDLGSIIGVYAYLKEIGDYHSYENILYLHKKDKAKDNETKLMLITKNFLLLLNSNEIRYDEIVFESGCGNMSGNATKIFTALETIIKVICIERNLKYTPIHTRTLNAWIKKNRPNHIKSNINDAYALYEYWKEMNNK